MITTILLSVFSILGLSFMVWVIVAIEFEIHRMHRNRDLFFESIHRR